ncbi:MAG TPA: IS110 family transposase [Tenericutes bacterium]|nr:IS110 family transposase [Mycoplasmatota bacterium]
MNTIYSSLIDIIIYNSSKLNEVKQDIINLAKQTPYFEIVNSIYGIGEISTAQIIAEVGDINRFENIKQLKKLQWIGSNHCTIW